eukprot:scaffold18059_cov94-Skeletonema_dohrnii-CCMP3373.AAC.4
MGTKAKAKAKLCSTEGCKSQAVTVKGGVCRKRSQPTERVKLGSVLPPLEYRKLFTHMSVEWMTEMKSLNHLVSDWDLYP